jgi:hypothetical protein
VWGVGRIADHFQAEIRLDAGAHVELAIVKQRPAAVCTLDPAQIIPDLRFQHRVDGFCEIMSQ